MPFACKYSIPYMYKKHSRWVKFHSLNTATCTMQWHTLCYIMGYIHFSYCLSSEVFQTNALMQAGLGVPFQRLEIRGAGICSIFQCRMLWLCIIKTRCYNMRQSQLAFVDTAFSLENSSIHNSEKNSSTVHSVGKVWAVNNYRQELVHFQHYF